MNTNNIGHSASSDFLSDLGKAARDNPVPAALIGMGIVWLFSGAKPVSRIGELARGTGLDRLPEGAAASFEAGRSAIRSGVSAASDVASQAGSRFGETVQGVGAQIGETITAASDNLKATGSAAVDRMAQTARSLTGRMEGVQSSPDFARNVFADLRANVMDAFHRQPLLLGAVGIAIGAGIAASFPSSAREAELLGARSDHLKEAARHFALEQARRAGELASNAASAAADEARVQGLTIDEAKAAAADIGAKLKNVAKAATNSAQRGLD
jgi:hypothetical protein